MHKPDPASLALLKAISFAARAHRWQMRKDRETPYASHVFRVCLIARHVFGIDDTQALTAAVLHDTVEDTNTDYDDLRNEFGDQVAGWVALLSKDKRLVDQEREAAYRQGLAAAPWQVKVCKLADIYDNLTDSVNTKPDAQARTFQRSADYLAALQTNLPEQARRPWEMVAELLAEMRSQKNPN